MNGIWRFEDLGAWKLAVQLQTLANQFCDRPAIKRDFKFHDQLSDAAASGPRNIAEGFGRYYHPEFAQFGRIAKASEEEVLKSLLSRPRQTLHHPSGVRSRRARRQKGAEGGQRVD
jgi:four helix bundle protein